MPITVFSLVPELSSANNLASERKNSLSKQHQFFWFWVKRKELFTTESCQVGKWQAFYTL